MMHDEYDPKYVRLKNVEWFNVEINPLHVTVGQLRDLSVKVVEEAAEAMAAGKECVIYADKQRLKEELADTIQACCNLAAAFGIFDLRDAIDECRDRNTIRGRISKKVTKEQEEVMKFFEEHRDSGFTEPDNGV